MTGDVPNIQSEFVARSSSDAHILSGEFLALDFAERAGGCGVVDKAQSGATDTGSRAVGLQATAVATAAATAVGLYDDVTQLTCEAVVTIDNVAIANETTTQTCTECNLHEVFLFEVFTTAIVELAQSSSVGVVGHSHSLHCGEAFFDQTYHLATSLFLEVAQSGFGGFATIFPGEVGGVDDSAFVVVGVGSTNTDTCHKAVGRSLGHKFLDSSVEQIHILVEENGALLRGRTLGMEFGTGKAVTLAVDKSEHGVGATYIDTNGELFFHL